VAVPLFYAALSIPGPTARLCVMEWTWQKIVLAIVFAIIALAACVIRYRDEKARTAKLTPEERMQEWLDTQW
jgi:hypothetical protein